MITPEDDHPHQAGSEPNFNESMYLHLHDPASGIGGFLRVANRPNEGRGERTVCLYLPGGRVAFGFARPVAVADTGAGLLAGAGLSFQVAEPFRRLSVCFDGRVHLLSDPAALADPGPGLAAAPEVPCRVRLDVRASAAPHEQTFESDGASFAPHHYEQLVRADGVIEVDGDVYEVAGHGLRDHSWGPRSWQAPWFYRWLHGSSEHLGFMAAWFEDQDGTRRTGGFVWAEDKLLPVDEVTLSTARDRHGHQTSVELVLRAGGRTWPFAGAVECAVPLRHRRGADLTRIVEGSTVWTGPGGVALRGMAEYLDQIIEGQPVGVAV